MHLRCETKKGKVVNHRFPAFASDAKKEIFFFPQMWIFEYFFPCERYAGGVKRGENCSISFSSRNANVPSSPLIYRPTPRLGNKCMCTVAKMRQKSLKGYTECKRAHVWLRELYGAVFVVPPFTELHFCIFLIRLLLLFIAGGLCWKMRNWEKKRREWGGNGRTLNKGVQKRIKYILQIKLVQLIFSKRVNTQDISTYLAR